MRNLPCSETSCDRSALRLDPRLAPELVDCLRTRSVASHTGNSMHTLRTLHLVCVSVVPFFKITPPYSEKKQDFADLPASVEPAVRYRPSNPKRTRASVIGLGGVVRTNEYQTRVVEWLSGAVRIPYVYHSSMTLGIILTTRPEPSHTTTWDPRGPPLGSFWAAPRLPTGSFPPRVRVLTRPGTMTASNRSCLPHIKVRGMGFKPSLETS